MSIALMTAPALADDSDLPPAPKPHVPGVGKVMQDFVPKGWVLQQSAKGDIDGDGVADLALVIQSTDPELVIQNPDGLGADEFDSNPRTLIIATYMPASGMFRRVGQGDDVIPRIDNPVIDDPFEVDALSIDKGAIKLNIRFWASAGSWSMSSTIFTFRYRADGKRPKAVYLVGLDRDEIHRGSGEENWTSVNFLTGKMNTSKGSIEEDVAAKEVWKNLGRKSLVRLDELPNGWEFAADFE